MKIFTKLFISFLAVSLIPLGVMTLFSYNRWSQLAQDEQIDALSEILKSRMYYMAEYFDSMKDLAELMGRTENLSNMMEEISKPEDNKPLDTESLRPMFTYFVDAFEVGDAYLISKKGDVVFSFNKNQELGSNLYSGDLKDTQLGIVFRKAAAALSPEISRFAIYPVTNSPVIFIAAPIFHNGSYEGIFAFQIPPTEIYKIFQDYTSLKETGELLIGTSKENEILFVNPIRHYNDSAFKFTLPKGSPLALPMQDAVKRLPGKGVSIDYRNKKIIAVWDYFPELDWGVVVKIDVDEALAPINSLNNIVVLIAIITFLIIFIVVLLAVRHFLKPIKRLLYSFELVGKGDFDVEVSENTKDEIGDLARSFSDMVKKLRASVTSIEKLNVEVEARKKSEEAKTELLSRVSHELRTPIVPIKDGIELLLKDRDGTLNENQKQILELATQNTNRLLELVEALLSLETVSETKNELKFEEIDINALLEQMFQNGQEHLNGKPISFHMHLDANARKVLCDREMISRVFTYLMDNAIKFTEKGTITLETHQKEKEIEISFADTGIGISVEDSKKLFQPFRELDITASEKKQGLGLSLVSAKEIVEAHGGEISAISTKGEGSVFYVKLKTRESNL